MYNATSGLAVRLAVSFVVSLVVNLVVNLVVPRRETRQAAQAIVRMNPNALNGDLRCHAYRGGQSGCRRIGRVAV